MDKQDVTRRQHAFPASRHRMARRTRSSFYKKAFGAKELMRLEGQDGKLMHACVSINDASRDAGR